VNLVDADRQSDVEVRSLYDEAIPRSGIEEQHLEDRAGGVRRNHRRRELDGLEELLRLTTDLHGGASFPGPAVSPCSLPK
jgi:hypothetical protein